MSEHCHCTHAVQKRACQHQGFFERIKELEDANKDKSQLLASFRKDNEELQAKVKKLEERISAETDEAYQDGYQAALKENDDE